MCITEAISIKSAAARHRELRHCVIQVNSRIDVVHEDITINMIIGLFIIIIVFGIQVLNPRGAKN